MTAARDPSAHSPDPAAHHATADVPATDRPADRSPEPVAGLELAATVAALRAELTRAMSGSGDPEIRFPVGEITLEFHVRAARQADARAGVRFWVVEAGAGGSVSREEVHTVRVTLQPPVDRAGRPVHVTRAYPEMPR